MEINTFDVDCHSACGGYIRQHPFNSILLCYSFSVRHVSRREFTVPLCEFETAAAFRVD